MSRKTSFFDEMLPHRPGGLASQQSVDGLFERFIIQDLRPNFFNDPVEAFYLLFVRHLSDERKQGRKNIRFETPLILGWPYPITTFLNDLFLFI